MERKRKTAKTAKIAKIRLLAYQETERKKGRVAPASKLIAVALILSCASSCSGVVTFASTEGLEAQGRARTGLVEQAMSGQDAETAYWQNEKMRTGRKSWIERMIIGGDKNATR